MGIWFFKGASARGIGSRLVLVRVDCHAPHRLVIDEYVQSHIGLVGRRANFKIIFPGPIGIQNISEAAVRIDVSHPRPAKRDVGTDEHPRVDFTRHRKAQTGTAVLAETLHRLPRDLLIDLVLGGSQSRANVVDFHHRQADRTLVVKSGEDYHSDELAAVFSEVKIVGEVSGEKVG